MRSASWSVVGVAALIISGCFLIPGGGGGGGGTGGGTAFAFTSGFATVRKEQRTLFVTDQSDPNAPLQLGTTGGISMPSFSRDGRRVVFSRRTTTTDTELMVVPSTGGTPSTVLRSTATQQNLRAPVFSPDGTTIAFVYDDNPPSSSIGLVNVDGSNFRKLIGGGPLAYHSPSYFPDGKTLLVAVGNAGLTATQVERVDVLTGAPSTVTNVLGDSLGIMTRLAVSPDGTRAVYDGRVASGATRIFVLDLVTRVSTRQRDPVSAANDTGPCWMNATTFAFSSDEGGADQVYRQTVGTTNAVFEVPLAIEPAFGLIVASADGGVADAGVDGGP